MTRIQNSAKSRTNNNIGQYKCPISDLSVEKIHKFGNSKHPYTTFTPEQFKAALCAFIDLISELDMEPNIREIHDFVAYIYCNRIHDTPLPQNERLEPEQHTLLLHAVVDFLERKDLYHPKRLFSKYNSDYAEFKLTIAREKFYMDRFHYYLYGSEVANG